MGLCSAADIRSSGAKRGKFSFSPRKWTQWSFAMSNLKVAWKVRSWKWMTVDKFKTMTKPSQKWANMQLTARWLLFQGFFYWQIEKLLNQSSLGNLFVKHSTCSIDNPSLNSMLYYTILYYEVLFWEKDSPLRVAFNLLLRNWMHLLLCPSF